MKFPACQVELPEWLLLKRKEGFEKSRQRNEEPSASFHFRLLTDVSTNLNQPEG